MNRPATLPEETAACCVTAQGRSAVAVVAIQGPKSRDCIDHCFQSSTIAPIASPQIRYGTWRGSQLDSSDPGESVVITPLDDQHFEIHCHGGTAAVHKILESLSQHGAHVIGADEFAFNRSIDLLNREANECLIRCKTQRQTAIALDQVRGAMAAWVASCHLLDLANQQSEATRVLSRAEIGRHLTTAYQVVLTGPPNVGKSSLINRILGFDRSIAHDQAGTTRDVVRCDTVIDGLPIQLSDTAGLRHGGDDIEQEGMRLAKRVIGQADLVLIVMTPDSVDHLESFADDIRLLQPKHAKTLQVVNKWDTAKDRSIAADRYPTIAVATENQSLPDGISELMNAIVEAFACDDYRPGDAVPINQRQIRCLTGVQNSVTLAESQSWLNELVTGK